MRTAVNVHGVSKIEVTPVLHSLREGGSRFQYVTITTVDGSVLTITAHLAGDRVTTDEAQREAA